MATKIQVRRDTTDNWNTYGAEVPAAGEFCYDTDAKTLKIGDGVTAYRDLNVIADADFDATEINNNYVAVTGDNMTGDLTLGTDKITLGATDGSAEFTNTVRTDKGYTCYPQNDADYAFGTRNAANDTWSAYITGDGNGIFAGTVEAGKPTDNAVGGVRIAKEGQLHVNYTGNDAADAEILLGLHQGSEIATIFADGSAEFAGGLIKLRNDGINGGRAEIAGTNSRLLLSSSTADNTATRLAESLSFSYEKNGVSQIVAKQSDLVLYASNNTNTQEILRLKGADGNAEFSGSVRTDGGLLVYPPTDSTYSFATRNGANDKWSAWIQGDGTAYFTGGTVSPSMVIQLEAENDDNYTVTTDTEGNETRVYNGPTLDVKAVIQELQQRVADRDAVIASFATRLAQLEADHSTLMGNNNGGY